MGWGGRGQKGRQKNTWALRHFKTWAAPVALCLLLPIPLTTWTPHLRLSHKDIQAYIQLVIKDLILNAENVFEETTGRNNNLHVLLNFHLLGWAVRDRTEITLLRGRVVSCCGVLIDGENVFWLKTVQKNERSLTSRLTLNHKVVTKVSYHPGTISEYAPVDWFLEVFHINYLNVTTEHETGSLHLIIFSPNFETWHRLSTLQQAAHCHTFPLMWRFILDRSLRSSTQTTQTFTSLSDYPCNCAKLSPIIKAVNSP